MSRITFCKLTQAQYDAIETPNPETVYFLTDANAICLGSRTYVSREKADRFLVKRVFAHDTYGILIQTIPWSFPDTLPKKSPELSCGLFPPILI